MGVATVSLGLATALSEGKAGARPSACCAVDLGSKVQQYLDKG